nr:hypothetical protein B0A51_08177 [Rachicladosporium sp. CCFEE 5018]
MSLDLGLQDVHVLITGAAGGIGFSLVQTFAALGARITAHINTNRGALDTVPNITILQADVRSEQSITDLFAQAATQNGGPVSILIVNHGIWPTNDAPISDMSLDQWQNTLSVNLTGPFLLCKAYLRALATAPDSVTDHANIIFIGSTAGKFGEAAHGDYAASKAALMYGLTPTLKNEIVKIAPRGRVNSVNPGWVATPMAEETLKDEAFVSRALQTTPLRKVARVEDVSRQVAVLASQVVSGHVSGVNVMVDGGMEGRVLWLAGGS